MPKTENTSVKTTTDSKGKTYVSATTTLSESKTSRTYQERYQMTSILNLPNFIIFFILFVFSSTILYFVANKETFVPEGNLYVQYSNQDIIDLQIDRPITELNNHTLREVFEGLVTNPDLTNISGWTNVNSVISFNENISTILANAQYGGIVQDITSIVGNKHYLNVRWKPSSTTQRIVHQQFTTQTYQPTSVGTWQNYTKIDTVTSNPGSEIRFTDNGSSGWLLFEVDYYYVVDMTSLGISSLTVSQMDYWYSVYQDILNGEIPEETRLSLGTIDPNSGKDFYFVDNESYRNLGKTAVQGFTGMFKFIETISAFIDDTYNIIIDVGTWLDNFLNDTADSVKNWFSDIKKYWDYFLGNPILGG